MNNTNLLIVEDESLVAEDLKINLENLDYNIIGILNSGEETLEYLKTHSPDLILMDIKLKGTISGIETAEEILSKYNIPIIFLTAFTDEDLIDKATKAEPYGYILKPFDSNELKISIKIALYKHKMEQKLIASNKRYQDLFDYAPDMYFSLDINCKIVDVNKFALESLGYHKEELLEQFIYSLTHEEDILHLQEKIKKIITEKIKYSELTFKIIKKDLSVIDTQIRVNLIMNKNGEVVEVRLICRDITNQKKAEKILIKKSRMEATATLAGGIAHDFNNLMVGVIGNVDLINLFNKFDEKTKTKLSEIKKSGKKASLLAKQMLAYAGGGKYVVKENNFNTLAKEFLNLDPLIFPENISIKSNFCQELWEIESDASQMKEVLLNLVKNSIESIASNKGEIEISTNNIIFDFEMKKKFPWFKKDQAIEIVIKDNGSGIDKKNISKIFEPFFTTKLQGRGLGLAAVYGIIKNHEGIINVESDVNKGTSISIYLPATISDKIEDTSSKIEDKISNKNKTILIVDDDDLIQKITKETLTYFNYEVLVASDGKEAVDIAKTFKGSIDLVLLDLGMPVMNGLKALPLLHEARPDMKIIICSGYDNLTEILDTQTEKIITDYLKKPYTMNKLTEKITKVLK